MTLTLTQWTPNRLRSYDRFNRMMKEVFGAEVRTFSLSVPATNNAIEATFKDGFLTVILPKAEITPPYKIAVKTG